MSSTSGLPYLIVRYLLVQPHLTSIRSPLKERNLNLNLSSIGSHSLNCVLIFQESWQLLGMVVAFLCNHHSHNITPVQQEEGLRAVGAGRSGGLGGRAPPRLPTGWSHQSQSNRLEYSLRSSSMEGCVRYLSCLHCVFCLHRVYH